jgi:hypothetical protein
LCIFSIIFYFIFNPLFKSSQVIITYSLRPFNIVSTQPKLWEFLKKLYIVTFLTSNAIYSKYIYDKIIYKLLEKNHKSNEFIENENSIRLLIGKDEKKNENIFVPESGLYQNFLITGTIGSGKTSSAMYPYTRTINEIQQ